MRSVLASRAARTVESMANAEKVAHIIGKYPTDLASCVLWCVADDITGVADGGDVASWPDRAGATVEQTTAANRPTLDYDEIDGKHAVRFTAANGEHLTSDATDGGSKDIFIVAIAKNATASGTQRIVDASGNWLVGTRGTVLTGYSGAFTDRSGSGLSLTSPYLGWWWCDATNNAFRTLGDSNDGINDLPPWRLMGQQGANVQPGTFRLGGPGSSNYFDGWLAEIAIFNDLPAWDDALGVLSYFRRKYDSITNRVAW